MQTIKILDEMSKKIASLQSDIAQLKEALTHKEPVVEAAPAPAPAPAPVVEVAPAPVETPSEFQQLKTLLESDAWPHAVNPALICNVASEEDKVERAEGILDIMVDTTLTKEMKFLDFGCGEGHVAIKAKERCDISIGYDIKQAWKTESDLLTTDFEKVKAHAPYSVVLLYDVLDHATNESPTNILQKVKSLTDKNSIIYMRCHPWIGRHGGHLYQQINKAFAHVVFDNNELEIMGYTIDNTQKITRPLAQYFQFVKDSGLISKNNTIDAHPVEDFFKKNKLVNSRIMKLKIVKEFPEFQMRQSFVDFVLNNPS